MSVSEHAELETLQAERESLERELAMARANGSSDGVGALAVRIAQIDDRLNELGRRLDTEEN